MNNQGNLYPILPGNCPGQGYVPVSKEGFIEAPLSGEKLKWEKLTQVTDADKEQIQENKRNIESLSEDLDNTYNKDEVDSALADKEDKFTVDSTLEKDDANKTLKVKYLENHGLHRFATGLGVNVDGTTIGFDGQGKLIVLGGGGGGFTPTQSQLDAMNSGIDSTKVGQIQTNKEDIASLETEVDNLDTDKADKDTTYTKTEVNSLLDNKVDKVSGKGLSTNDFTNADKTKLDGLVNVSGTNDGTNWTKLNINGVEKNIPAGGGTSTKYQHNIRLSRVTLDPGRESITFTIINDSNSPIESLDDLKTAIVNSISIGEYKFKPVSGGFSTNDTMYLFKYLLCYNYQSSDDPTRLIPYIQFYYTQISQADPSTTVSFYESFVDMGSLMDGSGSHPWLFTQWFDVVEEI